MFDLETAIADWKRSLAARESLSADNIAELETHLRECVSSLNAMGLSGEEAFLVAQRRVGQPSELDFEFEKESPSTRWVHRGKWMCIGILALIMVRSAGSLVYGILRPLGSPTEVDPINQVLVTNYALIACSWLIVLAGLFVVLRHDTLIDRIAQRLARTPKPVLFGVPIAAIIALNVLSLFNIYMTSGYGHTAARVSMVAFDWSPLILFLVAAYILHRSEQRRALA